MVRSEYLMELLFKNLQEKEDTEQNWTLVVKNEVIYYFSGKKISKEK